METTTATATLSTTPTVKVATFTTLLLDRGAEGAEVNVQVGALPRRVRFVRADSLQVGDVVVSLNWDEKSLMWEQVRFVETFPGNHVEFNRTTMRPSNMVARVVGGWV